MSFGQSTAPQLDVVKRQDFLQRKEGSIFVRITDTVLCPRPRCGLVDMIYP